MSDESRPPLIGGLPFFEDEDEHLRGIRRQILTYRAADLMNDRERAAWLGLPKGCRIRENAKIIAPEKLTLGEYVWIGEGAILDAQGGLTIGDFTQIGLSVMVWSHSSHRQARRGETAQTSSSIVYQPTTIGSRCFIGGPSVIAPGVTVGDGVIISPMTFVDSDVPDGTIVGGNRPLQTLEARVAELEEQMRALMQRLEAGE